MNIIKKVPTPICGLALAFAALGNLVQSYSETVRYLFGGISALLLLLLILKMIFETESFKNDMKNPVMASVFATFPMAIMLLSAYLKPFIGNMAFIIWLLGILIHILLIIYFTMSFVLNLNIQKVFASYFIVYVGIVCASVTAPAFGKEASGTIIFWFGFVSMLVLLGLISYRYVKHPDIDVPLKPLICIYAAPISLLIAGYIQSVGDKNPTFLKGMLIASVVIYIAMILKSFQFVISGKFFPSFSAMTFPFVISAIASKQSMAFLGKIGQPISLLPPLVLVQTILAVFYCFFVLSKYMGFLLKKES